MVLRAALLQAAFEYGAANGFMAELTQVSRNLTRFARDHWIALAVVVVILFLMTRGFRAPR